MSNKVWRERAFGASVVAVLAALLCCQAAAWEGLRLDCGPPGSPVMDGCERLTGNDIYGRGRGFGWEGVVPRDVPYGYGGYLGENVNDLSRDGVMSSDELVFRADVPDGTYRVAVVVGDLTRALGSIDVWMNGKLVAERVTPWGPGSYRGLMKTPGGSLRYVRATVPVTDGTVRIRLTKNQSYYDQQLEEQRAEENPYTEWHHKNPVISAPPYYYIGWPFVHNAVMGIEIVPDVPAPVVSEKDRLKVSGDIESGSLGEAISKYNDGDFAGAAKALENVVEPEAQVAKAIVQLWLAGRLEIEEDKQLVPAALGTLAKYSESHPEEPWAAELVEDAEIFQKAYSTYATRGETGENHFVEINKSIALWWLVSEDSPLWYKAQLYSARAAHMLLPYMPTLGVECSILKELEKKFPDNRHVRYLLHWEWEQYGDGSHPEDWRMPDYSDAVAGAPEWVRQLFPAWASLVDVSEWWIRFKQRPDGSIGGGWGDDVEIVGLFGYMGYTGRGVSELAVRGARNLVEGMWNSSEIDPELGYCLPMADAEHSAEWTGNTLGMMVQIDYGNPVWIERSMKTGKLMRDLWTAYNKKGRRHFRSNFLGAKEVGVGDRANDSWINYRAVRPAAAVLAYNQNPTISKLFVELADGWLTATMSTERGKPRGVIPAQVSFPDGIIGGINSPNWYTASHPSRTVNYDWTSPQGQRYKEYIVDLLLKAFEQTRDPRYLQPLQLEYELAASYGNKPAAQTGARLQKMMRHNSFGWNSVLEREPRLRQREQRLSRDQGSPAVDVTSAGSTAEAGSEQWVAESLEGTENWFVAQRMLKGREGKLENDITKDDIIDHSIYVNAMMKLRWPQMTTEASATDRVGFGGICNPFFFYTGGRMGGPLLEAAVTYENTTKNFAAAVLGSDRQGFRIIYYSMAPETREIGIVPWHLEPAGKYMLRYGLDTNDDEVIDSLVEQREFFFPQLGAPIHVMVRPRVTYVIEVDQLERGKKPGLAPDPGLSARDIGWDGERLLATVHNAGSKSVENVRVAFYDGDPEAGGIPVGTSLVSNIDAPNDLEPQTVAVGVEWAPAKPLHDIYVVLDPDDEIKDEITTFNNVAHKILPEKAAPALQPKRTVPTGSFRSGRR